MKFFIFGSVSSCLTLFGACLSQRPHGVPGLSLHVQMHAAGHHGEPGAFGQQLDARSQSESEAHPEKAHQRAFTPKPLTAAPG